MTTTTAKVALVTGANKGIGKETVRQLAACGYIVYLAARDAARGSAAATELRETGVDVRFIHLDVTKIETIAAAATTMEHDVGRLDVLVNNAGIGLEIATPSKANLDTIRSTYEVNVIGPVAVIQGLLPLLKAGPSKVIVNLSSELGSLSLHRYPAFPFGAVNAFAYNSSKTALNALTVLLAKELAAEGFRVNSVSPGFAATDINGHSGTLTAEEAARVVVRYATLEAHGPTGGFFTEGGEVPW